MQMSGLIVLLPHGFEGQGPEHSSARLERYLQLAADKNMTIAFPTNPASLFHLLRRHMIRKDRKPLVIMSPKSLLRHPMAISNIEDLSKGKFQEIIDDEKEYHTKATKIVLCSGKIYYDLLGARTANNISNIAIIRLEQLYPFPENIANIVEKYRIAKEIVWCQEEPKNMGAWTFVNENLNYNKLQYVGRKAAASPATGFLSVHQNEQEAIIKEIFKLK
jgi:2-oxoglutarate dehydrogenase E1 component